MYRIAICDDEKPHVNKIVSLLKEYCAESGLELDIETFADTADLRSRLTQGIKFSMIFQDIKFQHDHEAGIKLGVWLRNELKDRTTQLFYISSYMDYIEDMFAAKPQDFIRKPYYKRTFLSKFERAIQYCEDMVSIEKHFFTIKTEQGTYSLDISKIMYLWVTGRVMHVKTTTHEHSYYGALKDAYSELKDYDFLMACRSHIINYNLNSASNYNEEESGSAMSKISNKSF